MESDLQNILNDLKKVWNDFHYYYARQDFFRFLISSLSSLFEDKHEFLTSW